jgi:hypothetical protein
VVQGDSFPTGDGLRILQNLEGIGKVDQESVGIVLRFGEAVIGPGDAIPFKDVAYVRCGVLEYFFMVLHEISS